MLSSVGATPSVYPFPVLPLPSVSASGNLSSFVREQTTSSLFSAALSNPGFTKEGIAFLALMALSKEDGNDEKLTSAQKLALIALMLGGGQNTDISVFSSSSTTQILNYMPAFPAGYAADASAVSANRTSGLLYDANV